MAIAKHVLRSSPLVLLPLLLLAASVVMLFFCLLAGASNHNPLNRAWFLQADTSGIPNAPNISHFNMYNACPASADGITDCPTGRTAAHPMLPQTYFNTPTNVPRGFFDKEKTFYYLSRFTYAFYIISIFWILVAMVAILGALFSTLATGIASAITLIALLSTAFLASIMTACYVMAQKAFHDAGRFARVGVKTFAWTWTSLVLVGLSLLCLLSAFFYRKVRQRQIERESNRIGTTGRTSRKRDSMLSRLVPGHREKGYEDRKSYENSDYYNSDGTYTARGAATAQNYRQKEVAQGQGEREFVETDYRPVTRGEERQGTGTTYEPRAPPPFHRGTDGGYTLRSSGGARSEGVSRGPGTHSDSEGVRVGRKVPVTLNTGPPTAPVTGYINGGQPVTNPEVEVTRA